MEKNSIGIVTVFTRDGDPHFNTIMTLLKVLLFESVKEVENASTGASSGSENVLWWEREDISFSFQGKSVAVELEIINLNNQPEGIPILCKLSSLSVIPQVFFNELNVPTIEKLKEMIKTNYKGIIDALNKPFSNKRLGSDLRTVWINPKRRNTISSYLFRKKNPIYFLQKSPDTDLAENDTHVNSDDPWEISIFIDKIRNPMSGFVIKDRSYHLRKYRKCFVGRELVDWIMKNNENNRFKNREDATQYCRFVQSQGYWHHVLRDHDFKDEYLFYRFEDDEKDSFKLFDIPPLNDIHFVSSSIQKEIQSKKYIIEKDNTDEILSDKMQMNDEKDILDPCLLVFELRKMLLQVSMHPTFGDYKTKKWNHYVTYRKKAVQLLKCNIDEVLKDDSIRKSFFINLFNCIMIHACIENGGFPVHTRATFFSMYKYKLGPYVFTLSDIEHGILRCNSPSPSPAALPFSTYFKSKDPRKKFMLQQMDPRIHFALCCGKRTYSPIVKILNFKSGEVVEKELEYCTRECAYWNVIIDLDAKSVQLPKIMDWYKHDFIKYCKSEKFKAESTLQSSSKMDSLLPLHFLYHYVQGQDQNNLQFLISFNSEKLTISFSKYDWHMDSFVV